MESSGEAGDDHGSGWLQVKKKHRSSSKFSLQGWVGGLSGKQPSNIPHTSLTSNLKGGNSHGKYGSQPPKARGDFPVRCQGSGGHSTSFSNEYEKGVHYLDKCVVSQDCEYSKSSKSVTLNVTKSDTKTGGVEQLPQDDKPNILRKIKWGDLDEGALVLDHEITLGAEIKFGDIGNRDLFSSKSKDTSLPVSCTSCSDNQGNEILAVAVDADRVFDQMPVSPSDELREENCKVVNEVSSTDVKVQVPNEKMVDPSDDHSNCRETQCGHANLIDTGQLCATSPSGENMSSESIQVAQVLVELPAPAVICEAGDAEISEGLASNVISHDPEPPSKKNKPETSGESPEAASSEDCKGKQAGVMPNDFSKAQFIGAIGAGEGESKERFRQRLWCFLFENLNRAVDELYLLCELECDVDQMKEAILVLEEAASDFKELNFRVDKFEKVKKSSSQLLDGTPVAMKSDHRRPHALSWEVRRMTTSPHRAEILSSSLEAFRKIQQELTSTCAANDAEKLGIVCSSRHNGSDISEKHGVTSDILSNSRESVKLRKHRGVSDPSRGNMSGDKRNGDAGKSYKLSSAQNSRPPPQNTSSSIIGSSNLPSKEYSAAGKSKREQPGSSSEMEKLLQKKDRVCTESMVDRNPRCTDYLRKQIPVYEKDKEKRNGTSWKSMDAWKEKRNWEDILVSPLRVSSRFSHSPGMSRKSAERVRILRDKLMSPEKKKKTALDLKKEAEEKHARAMRIRSELENERVQKLQRSSEKLNRVNEWQAVRSMKLREGMHARHQRSETRHEAFLAQVARRAGDESSKVNEVRFITSLNDENKKFILRQKLHDSELRRAEKLQVMKSKQKEDMAREEAVLERKKLIEAEKLQRLAETQRKKEEAQVRREEERKASSAAREAKALKQLRKKEVRAKAQAEEAELLAQKLAEKLSESVQRRKFYLEQIRERASMDFRDQSSPLLRRALNKESQGRSTPTSNGEDTQPSNISCSGGSTLSTGNVVALQHLVKRRIKKIRQRLMALKYEFIEPPISAENAGIGYRTAVGTARAKIGRWLQELQRLRQARKEGAASIGLITAEIIKFLEGKEPELQASRQAGLLDFVASALPASHTSKPEACQVTIYLLRLLRVVLSAPANRSYFLAQNFLPPMIPMLAAALENYIKIAASANVPGGTNLLTSKTSTENLELISEILDGFLWTVAIIIGHVSSDERQLHMQDGLLELVVAYQVIHRLRDLFALYDRPQVEGSPFPSSILLSINLLAVLTSKSRIVPSINWEAFPVEMMLGNKSQETKVPEASDYIPPFSALNGSTSVSLADVPEDRPLDVSCTIKRHESITLKRDSGNDESICAKIGIAQITEEPQAIVIDNAAKSSLHQKDDNITSDDYAEHKSENELGLKQPIAFLLSAISETGLVCLPSLLTAVLLQANNRLYSEQSLYVLPSNFEEVATGVLKVFNNLALIDITFMQRMLARPDLKMEYFHFMSFLLSHCTSNWKVASDQIGLLLLESMSLLGYFSLFHRENQAVLRWGKSPTILHKVCDLPFVFFSDPELMPVLAGTLVAACFGCEQNKGVIQQELSTEMLLSLIKSCRNCLPTTVQSSSNSDIRSSRYNIRTNRVSAGKSAGSSGNSSTRTSKTRKDGKVMKLNEEMALNQNQSAFETLSTLMLHPRFPGSFIDRAEQFFAAEITCLSDEAMTQN